MGPAFGRNSEFYYNPLITKVQVTAEGIPNQLYAQGMLPYQHWDEIVKEFTREDLKSVNEVGMPCGSISGAATPQTARVGLPGGEPLGGGYAPAR